jgi:hypothetical protein
LMPHSSRILDNTMRPIPPLVLICTISGGNSFLTKYCCFLWSFPPYISPFHFISYHIFFWYKDSYHIISYITLYLYFLFFKFIIIKVKCCKNKILRINVIYLFLDK